jgi:hypothetical protein
MSDEHAAPPDDAHRGSATLPQDTMVVAEASSERHPPLNVDPSKPLYPTRERPMMTLAVFFCLLAVAILYRYCIHGP